MSQLDHNKLLNDIYHVFQKHGLPIETFEVDFSMKDGDFDKAFPELISYKAGQFFRTASIDKTEAAIRGKRRIPFDVIANWILKHIKPQLVRFKAELQRELTDVKLLVDHHLSTENQNSIYQYTFTLSLDCTLLNAPEHGKRNAVLSIFVSQMNRSSYPKLSAFAGWLADKESDGWGIDMFSQPYNQQENPTFKTLERLNKLTPTLCASLQRELHKTINAN